VGVLSRLFLGHPGSTRKVQAHRPTSRLRLIRIYGDFNHRDQQDRVRLDTFGSERDLAKLQTVLEPGLRVQVYDDSYEAEGILEIVEGGWRARILWETGKDLDS
jgi:hypothetical protein